ncbi:ParB/RepB/Spo0J family partition protein [Fusibacter tunisiensis]|uniref:ParB-like chromosome segregation protein Spo0J n=1 Tax=Fusibacter tunisiensis TaxID=1008308 RepID=A0ABS2MTP2_9FIRM|nr:ParB/RepB/Spo0J family partition protein [Fusibacter tunisiensis]MBM7562715.1 ParB-like chromosome segregation protein Spo0J [Fusibacter tunisiensis]
MNLLKDGIDNNVVVSCDSDKKLVIDNITRTYPIYKIRLDQLYYNDQNDRIATWIAQYKTENNVSRLDLENRVDYNDLIHNFITDSNRDAIRKTQNNIALVGQQECGVVLSDGRIIDGNRRYTCLRNIERDTGKTQYFDAVILDHSIENNAKQIKMLELMLQHGVDEKVGYNPIERLVGVYTDIIDRGLLTVREYADSVNQSESDIQLEVEKAKLMVEFLEFINAPKQFHLARHFNLVDPMKELYTMLKKIRDEDKKEDLKLAVFSQFLMQPFGDTTRHARKIKKIASNNKFFDEFLDEQMPFVEKVCDELQKFPKVSNKEINMIRSNENLKKNFLHSTDKFVNKVDGDTTRNQPIKQAEKAFDSLDLIDSNILSKLSHDQKEELLEKLNSIVKAVDLLRSTLNDE